MASLTWTALVTECAFDVFCSMLTFSCKRKQVYDPEDPRCARLTLTGKMVEVGPDELDFAKEAMFSR